MPYYRITVTDIHGQVKQGVRFDNLADIDTFHQKAWRKAFVSMKNMLKAVDVVMLTTNCDEVKAYLAKRRNSITGTAPAATAGKQKYDGYNNPVQTK